MLMMAYLIYWTLSFYSQYALLLLISLCSLIFLSIVDSPFRHLPPHWISEFTFTSGLISRLFPVQTNLPFMRASLCVLPELGCREFADHDYSWTLLIEFITRLDTRPDPGSCLMILWIMIDSRKQQLIRVKPSLGSWEGLLFNHSWKPNTRNRDLTNNRSFFSLIFSFNMLYHETVTGCQEGTILYAHFMMSKLVIHASIQPSYSEIDMA